MPLWTQNRQAVGVGNGAQQGDLDWSPFQMLRATPAVRHNDQGFGPSRGEVARCGMALVVSLCDRVQVRACLAKLLFQLSFEQGQIALSQWFDRRYGKGD